MVRLRASPVRRSGAPAAAISASNRTDFPLLYGPTRATERGWLPLGWPALGWPALGRTDRSDMARNLPGFSVLLIGGPDGADAQAAGVSRSPVCSPCRPCTSGSRPVL